MLRKRQGDRRPDVPEGAQVAPRYGSLEVVWPTRTPIAEDGGFPTGAAYDFVNDDEVKSAVETAAAECGAHDLQVRHVGTVG